MSDVTEAPFTPGSTASLAVTNATGRVAIPGDVGGKMRRQVRLYNAGATTVFIAFGTDNVTAAVTDFPLPSGAIEVLTLSEAAAARYVAAITASGTATLYVTMGEGV